MSWLSRRYPFTSSIKSSARRRSLEKICGSPPIDLTSAAWATGCCPPWAGGTGVGGPGAPGGLPPGRPDPPEGGPVHPPPGVEYWLRLALSLELTLAAVPIVREQQG